MSMSELKDYLEKFDAMFSAIASKVFEANQNVEVIRNFIISLKNPSTPKFGRLVIF